MTSMELEKLKEGDYVIVGYGRNGEQVARVTQQRSWLRPLRVEKYRRNSRSWTGSVRVEDQDVLRLANEKEIARVSR